MCQEISYHLRCLCHRMEVASEVALLDLETGKRSIWTEDYYPIAMVLFLRGRATLIAWVTHITAIRKRASLIRLPELYEGQNGHS
ncbi:hypothetical protein VTN31DRAFT_1092 [Thermomyces dupontii]|uniref:uncharacterized protein n=1 Tax=Talaromyces thermophilus TaxID=28565 RepID=UPI003743AA2A